MSKGFLTILNIGLDRDLLSLEKRTEAQARQKFYADRLPARLVHIVKAPHGASIKQIDLNDNLSIIPCPVRHWTQFIPAAIRLGNKLLRRESFDLIQVQEPFVSGLAGTWLGQRFRVPLVVGLYSDEIDNPVWLAESPLNKVANYIGKYVLKRAAAVRSDSLAVAERLSFYNFKNLTHIPFLITNSTNLLASDIKAQEVRLRLLDGLSGPLLLAVCRLEPEKNIPLMLAAFAGATKRNKGLVLAIAGHGSLEKALKQEAERIVPGRVRWLGLVSNIEMPAYYQAADLMLLSSNRESAARVLYESLLAGTPVLSTDTTGTREVVKDGVTGRIVPVGSVEAFTQALVDLCGTPDRLQKMGDKGQRYITSKVTGEAVIRNLRALYYKASGRFE